MKHLRNVPLSLFRNFLKDKGLKIIRTNGGHEVWAGKHTSRPVVIQTHIDPIPEFIIKNNLKLLGVSKKEFLEWI